MAATLSPETEAIIQRLKDEGQLVRNSGTNSIRSVKIQLSKFSSVFDTISSNVVEQTRILQLQNDLAEQAVTEQRTKDQFDEVSAADPERGYADSDARSDKMVDKIGEAVSKALSIRGALSFAKTLAMFGTGAFVGYNFIKGFMDDKTGGGFSSLEDSVVSIIRDMDWDKLKQDFLSMAQTIGDLSKSLATLLSKVLGFIENPWSLFAIGLGLGSGKFLAGKTLGKIFGTGAAGAAGAGGIGVAMANAFKSALGIGVRFGGPLALIAAALNPSEMGDGTLSGPAEERLSAQGIQRPDESLSSSDPDMYDRLSREYQVKLQEEMDRYAAEARVASDAQIAADDRARTPEQAAEEARLRAQNIARDAADAERRRQTSDLEAAQNNIENQGVSILGMNLRGTNINDMAASFGVEVADAFKETTAYRANSSNVDDGMTVIQRKLEAAQELSAPEIQFLRVLRGAINSNQSATETNLANMAASFEVLSGRGTSNPSQNRSAILSDQYVTENEQARTANSQRMQTAESGAGGGGGAVIINAPTTVSPVVNNVGGNKSVNQVSVRSGTGGGGGGFGGAMPYGLSGYLN